MENNIDNIITLDGKDKYMVVDQGNYNGKAYYLLTKLNEKEELTSVVSIVENDNGKIESVTDSKLLQALIKYFNDRASK